MCPRCIPKEHAAERAPDEGDAAICGRDAPNKTKLLAKIADTGPTTTCGKNARVERKDLAEKEQPHLLRRW